VRTASVLTLTCLVACSSVDNPAPGGAGGTAGTGGSTSTIGGSPAGNGGLGGGGDAGCRTAAECGVDTTCADHECIEGTCSETSAPKGTPCSESGGNLCDEGDCVTWAPLSVVNAPAPRSRHTAVWTGAEMLVWGGRTGPGVETADGGRYDPATDSWAPMSNTGAPVARHSHKAIWTGTEMIVWGGFGAAASRSDGGAYNPSTDSWRTIAPIASFAGRTNFVMEYTGAHVVIWGGRDGTTVLNSGARYNPVTDEWQPIAGSPLIARFNAESGWIGPGAPQPNGCVVMWGGSNLTDWLDDGAYYDPATDTWTPVASIPGNQPNGGAVPLNALEGAASVAFSSAGAFYLWGGWDGGNHYDTGYLLNMHEQVGGYWYRIDPTPDTPSPRRFHVTARWPSTQGYFVWGGCNDSQCSTTFGDGGFWWPAPMVGGSWTYVPEDPALVARSESTVVNTDDEVIIWGGADASNELLATGGRRRMPQP
jgi:hypothetical protein